MALGRRVAAPERADIKRLQVELERTGPRALSSLVPAFREAVKKRGRDPEMASLDAQSGRSGARDGREPMGPQSVLFCFLGGPGPQILRGGAHLPRYDKPPNGRAPRSHEYTVLFIVSLHSILPVVLGSPRSRVFEALLRIKDNRALTFGVVHPCQNRHAWITIALLRAAALWCETGNAFLTSLMPLVAHHGVPSLARTQLLLPLQLLLCSSSGVRCTHRGRQFQPQYVALLARAEQRRTCWRYVLLTA